MRGKYVNGKRGGQKISRREKSEQKMMQKMLLVLQQILHSPQFRIQRSSLPILPSPRLYVQTWWSTRPARSHPLVCIWSALQGGSKDDPSSMCPIGSVVSLNHCLSFKWCSNVTCKKIGMISKVLFRSADRTEINQRCISGGQSVTLVPLRH